MILLYLLRIQLAEKQYKDSFNEELMMFKERIRKRADEKIRIAQAEIEEEERQARLGPGGLDPVEVFESLPDVSQFVTVFLFGGYLIG
jgi:cell division cycle protein 37